MKMNFLLFQSLYAVPERQIMSSFLCSMYHKSDELGRLHKSGNLIQQLLFRSLHCDGAIDIFPGECSLLSKIFYIFIGRSSYSWQSPSHDHRMFLHRQLFCFWCFSSLPLLSTNTEAWAPVCIFSPQ